MNESLSRPVLVWGLTSNLQPWPLEPQLEASGPGVPDARFPLPYPATPRILYPYSRPHHITTEITVGVALIS